MYLCHGICIAGVQELSIAHGNRQALLAGKRPAKALIRIHIAVLELTYEFVGRVGRICFEDIRMRRYMIAHFLCLSEIACRLGRSLVGRIILVIAELAPAGNMQQRPLRIDVPGQVVQPVFVERCPAHTKGQIVDPVRFEGAPLIKLPGLFHPRLVLLRGHVPVAFKNTDPPGKTTCRDVLVKRPVGLSNPTR